MKKIYSTRWDEKYVRLDMKTYKKDRKSPMYSANKYGEGTYGVGVDGNVWKTSRVGRTPRRPMGYKRWLRHYDTGSGGEVIERTPSAEMVGYEDFIERKTMSDTELDPEMGIEVSGGEIMHEGSLSHTDEEGEVEATPETIVEDEPVVHTPTVI